MKSKLASKLCRMNNPEEIDGILNDIRTLIDSVLEERDCICMTSYIIDFPCCVCKANHIKDELEKK